MVGLAQAAATAPITGAGLTTGSITTATSVTVPAGSVISQTPIAGTLLNAGTAVNLVISAGPAVLSIGKSHTGNFTQGQTNATYTVQVSNANGAAPTSGTVTVGGSGTYTLEVQNGAGTETSSRWWTQPLTLLGVSVVMQPGTICACVSCEVTPGILSLTFTGVTSLTSPM